MRRTKASVVGMTEGAKNRRSRRTSNYFRCSCGWVGQPDDMAESSDGHTACPRCGARWIDMQVVHPPELRAGQRVRPCPWKHDEHGCMGQGQEGSGPGVAYCDSGLLPAKKATAHTPPNRTTP